MSLATLRSRVVAGLEKAQSLEAAFLANGPSIEAYCAKQQALTLSLILQFIDEDALDDLSTDVQEHVVDAELRSHGVDPIALAERGAAFVAGLAAGAHEDDALAALRTAHDNVAKRAREGMAIYVLALQDEDRSVTELLRTRGRKDDGDAR